MAVAVAVMFTSAEVQALSNSLVTELGREGSAEEAGAGGTRQGHGPAPARRRLPRAARPSQKASAIATTTAIARGPEGQSGAGGRSPGRRGSGLAVPAGCRQLPVLPAQGAPQPRGAAASLPLARDSKGSRGSSLRMWASSSRGAMGEVSPRQPLPAPGARTGPPCPSGTTPGADPL